MIARRHIRRFGEFVFQALLLVALLVPLFPGVFFKGEVAVSGNTLYVYAPWRHAIPSELQPQNVNLETPRQVVDWYYLSLRAMRDGELPLWNPYQFTGVPLLGAYQTAIFYPPRLLFLLIGDLYTAITVFSIFKLWLAGFLAYCCGRGLALQAAYARFFSIAYMLCGYMTVWYSYTTVDSMGWAPILFLGLERAIAGRWRPAYPILLIGACMMILAAGAQHTLAFSIVLAVYFVSRLVIARSWRNGVRACTIAGAAGMSALLVTAIQVLPFIETLSNSLPALECFFDIDPAEYHYTLFDAPALWAPWYFGTYLHGNFWGNLNPFYLMVGYVGIPCWIGASLFFSTGAFREARTRSILMALAAVVWLTLSGAGTQSLTKLPGVHGLRLTYFLAFFVFAFPYLAARALQHWFSCKRSLGEFLAPLIVAALIVAATGASYLYNKQNLDNLNGTFELNGSLVQEIMIDKEPVLPILPQRGTLSDFVERQILWSCALVFASTLALLFALSKTDLRAVGIVVLSIVLTADLLSAWYGMQPTSPREQVFSKTEALSYLQAKPSPHRIDFTALGIDGLPIPYGLEELRGYDAMVPKRFWTMFNAPLSPSGRAALLRAAAAPTQCFPAPAQGEPRVPEGYVIEKVVDGVIIAANTNALPRARLLGKTERCDSVDQMIDRINAPDFDPKVLAFVEGPIAPLISDALQREIGTANIREWTWNRVVIETEADIPAALILAEAYYPGWKARLDGASLLDIFPAYHVFRGVKVPAGKHTVEFDYLPLSFRIGSVVSFASLSALTIAALCLLLRKPKANVYRSCAAAQ